LGALAAQFVHACPDRSEIVGGPGPDALAAQFFHASPDHGKVVSGARSDHISSLFAWRT
jgi:hypothetical protein